MPANANTKIGISTPVSVPQSTTPTPSQPQHSNLNQVQNQNQNQIRTDNQSSNVNQAQNQNPTRTDNQPNQVSNPQTQGRPNPTIQQTAPTPGTSNPNSFMGGPPRKPTPQHHGGLNSQYAAPSGPPPRPNDETRNSDNRMEAELPGVPLTPTTSGGRFIPARNEMRHSPTLQQGAMSPGPGQQPSTHQQQLMSNFAAPHSQANTLFPDGPASPIMPERSERRRSRDNIVAPLNVSPVRGSAQPGHFAGQYNRDQSRTPPRASSIEPTARAKTPNFSHPAALNVGQAPSAAPPAPPAAIARTADVSTTAGSARDEHRPLGTTTTISSNNSPTTSTFSNTTPLSSHPVSTTQRPLGKKQSFTAALKGLHGAGEAIRGTVNEKIAHATHDVAEEERMRAVREKGMGEWRGSGLDQRSQGFREKAEQRMRTRRASNGGVHGSEGPGGLGAVPEREY